MVNQDRNVFASALLKLGVGDAMVTGMTRTFAQTIREVRQVLDPGEGRLPFGIHLMIGKNYTVFMADTTVNERPSAEELAVIAKETAAVARRLGHEPRVAFLSYSTFGNPPGRWLDNLREAVAILDAEKPGFEYEGEVAPDAALNPTVMANYPFSRLSAPANVLVMPGEWRDLLVAEHAGFPRGTHDDMVDDVAPPPEMRRESSSRWARTDDSSIPPPEAWRSGSRSSFAGVGGVGCASS